MDLLETSKHIHDECHNRQAIIISHRIVARLLFEFRRAPLPLYVTPECFISEEPP